MEELRYSNKELIQSILKKKDAVVKNKSMKERMKNEFDLFLTALKFIFFEEKKLLKLNRDSFVLFIGKLFVDYRIHSLYKKNKYYRFWFNLLSKYRYINKQNKWRYKMFMRKFIKHIINPILVLRYFVIMLYYSHKINDSLSIIDNYRIAKKMIRINQLNKLLIQKIS